MTEKLERLGQILCEKFGEKIGQPIVACGEVTIEVGADDYLQVAQALRDDVSLRFEQLIDLSGLDYSTFASETPIRRFAVSVHLLSVSNNYRLRLRTFAEDDDFPVLASLCDLWPSANWFEREAFDLFGVMFVGHPDLRRILMWEGYPYFPLRKDFPVQGVPTELPGVAFTEAAPTQGAPFATEQGRCPSACREPRSHKF